MTAAPPSDDLVVARARGRRVADRFRAVLDSTADELAGAYARGDGQAGAAVASLLRGGTREFRLAGVDLMAIDGRDGVDFRVIEVNSAPGFAYCTPAHDVWPLAYQATVRALLEPIPPDDWAGVAVLTESKIPIETAGFARALAAATGHPAWVLDPAALRRAARQPTAGDGVQLVVDGRPLRGGLRYLHDAPWDVLPPRAHGHFLNGTAIDLRGGRDKVQAHRALVRFADASGFALATPRSCIVGHRDELAAAEAALGRWIVRKIPDGNSGRGIDLLADELARGRAPRTLPLLVQEMLLPPPLARDGQPALHGVRVAGEHYAADLRVVLLSTAAGVRPCMVYGRRARRSFEALARVDPRRWADDGALDDYLKVNIAVAAPGGFTLETERLLLADDDGWDAIGLSLDAWRRAVAISALAVIAVDRHGLSTT
jgi:hypothetical protein